MTNHEIYVFILCFAVFSIFTALFTYVLVAMTKSEIRAIRHGLLDHSIKKQYEIKLTCDRPTPKQYYEPSLIREEYVVKKHENKTLSFLGKVFSLLLCIVFAAMFVFALYMHFTEDKAPNGIPSIKVVRSDSMATKYKNNTYLHKNNLDNQIQMFDIVICYHAPAEEDIKLYDIVVYELEDGTQVIHRIVGIEEPNEKHPNERHFLLQGDAVDKPDKFPVLYSQIKGIYTGMRIPFAGSFILFLQSPAGWLCIILVIFGIIATPIIEKKIEEEVEDRMRYLKKGVYRDAVLSPNFAYRSSKLRLPDKK